EDLSLSNEDDTLGVYAGELLIDTVSWDDGETFPDVSGASMAIDPDFMSAADNDVGGRWCAGYLPWTSGSDLGSPGVENPLCPNLDRDGDGYTPGEGDCDDLDASVGPGASEIWYDGFDQDCDAASDYDADLDGFDSDAYGGDDCDDSDRAINPDANEVWYDGVDRDCDTGNDYDADLDGYDSDGYGGTDCDDSDATINTAATESCDGADNDCDGVVDEAPCTTTCGNGTLETGEEYEPPPGPFTTATVDSATCRFDFSGVNQLYCNGSCSWAGGSGCDQSDADILCQLITGNENSTATSWTSTTALSEHGFTCPGTRYGTVTNTDRGVNVTVYYTDSNIRSSHGAGSVIAYPVCTDP
ncbi:MAG: putative metal-binding motif-containing protein, partial [Alphaproteobacteria bacterium]|nr:putative metal-binding motif-containing protein [Alphaproteobacteria bacterium]